MSFMRKYCFAKGVTKEEEKIFNLKHNMLMHFLLLNYKLGIKRPGQLGSFVKTRKDNAISQKVFSFINTIKL